MQDRDESDLNPRERVRRGAGLSPHPKQSIITRIPNQTSDERYLANSSRSNVYRQAMRVIMETPEMEERLSYITAGTLVTVFGSWLMGSMIKSRAFIMFVDIMLFLGSTAFAGLLIGIVLGEGFISKEIVLVLLFGLVGLLIVALLILLGSLLIRSTQRSQS